MQKKTTPAPLHHRPASPKIKKMKKISSTLLLFTVIILEGYVVLSAELIAIRQTIPFVGSGTDTVAIIIAAVLMPLAFGYYAGGLWRPSGRKHNASIRKKLLFNLLVSQTILAIGMSYAFIAIFFTTMLQMGVDHRLVMITIYSGLFLVVPVYLLGQTIPLVSNYFSKEKLAQITGRILFFSTIGSFAGATFSTIVLMSTVGVHNAASFSLILLTILVVLLSKNKLAETVLYSLALAMMSILVNSNSVMDVFNIVENNQYNTIMVFEHEGQRHLVLNNNASSAYSETGGKHPYIEFVEKQALEPIAGMNKEILVIGAGAFTFGLEDTTNHYDYVDIDGALQRVAEDYILKQKLTGNKDFHPLPARAFLTKTKKKYDLIFLDAYLGDATLPEHLVTKEFFEQIKAHLSDHGIVAANFITSPNFQNRFSRNVDNTFRAAFPNASRHVVEDDYSPWSQDVHKLGNIIYLYTHYPEAENDGDIYTDNINRVFIDKPKDRRMMRMQDENP